MRFFDPNSDEWVDGFETRYVFRGVGESTFALLPGAWRGAPWEAGPISWLIARDKDLLDTFAGEAKNALLQKNAHAAGLFRQTYGELMCRSEFIQFADDLGMNPSGAQRLDRRLCLELAAEAAINGYSFHEFGDLAVVQHSGLPTRLLDWTYNPYCALYFAASDREAQNNQASNNLALWALRIDAIERPLPGAENQGCHVEIYSPFRERNAYMQAQRGCFTLIRGAEERYRAEGKWPGVEDVVVGARDEKEQRCLRKFEIPKTLASEILMRLWRLGISEGYLKPTLENAARSMKERWAIEAANKTVGAAWAAHAEKTK